MHAVTWKCSGLSSRVMVVWWFLPFGVVHVCRCIRWLGCCSIRWFDWKRRQVRRRFLAGENENRWCNFRCSVFARLLWTCILAHTSSLMIWRYRKEHHGQRSHHSTPHHDQAAWDLGLIWCDQSMTWTFWWVAYHVGWVGRHEEYLQVFQLLGMSTQKKIKIFWPC